MEKCKLGMISQERLKIAVKLLLSANKKWANKICYVRMISCEIVKSTTFLTVDSW